MRRYAPVFADDRGNRFFFRFRFGVSDTREGAEKIGKKNEPGLVASGVVELDLDDAGRLRCEAVTGLWNGAEVCCVSGPTFERHVRARLEDRDDLFATSTAERPMMALAANAGLVEPVGIPELGWFRKVER